MEAIRPTLQWAPSGGDLLYAATADDVRLAIDRIVQRIVERFEPERIILFGSHARGQAGPDSDVDLLIVTPISAPKHRVTAEIHRVLAGMGLAKDIMVVTPEELERYREVPGTIVFSALSEGSILYERSVTTTP